MTGLTAGATQVGDSGAPLAGVTVLELGNMYAAPTTGRMLRDFGATVIKVEDPATGDFARQWVPQKNGLAMGFARLNAGKRSVGIDLRHASGRDLVRRLACSVDVVIESFRPGRMEEWGLDYPTLAAENPALVMTRVSGFGQSGPYRERPGFGTIAEAMSGYAFLNGWPETPPTTPPFGFADSIAGISAAFGTAMALFKRSVTNVGSVVDVALYEPLMFILGDAVVRYSATGEIAVRQGNSSGAASPRGIYQASDGHWLSIAASSQNIAMRLFEAMDRPDLKIDPKFSSNSARLENNDELQKIVIDWVGARPRASVLDIFEKFQVVGSAVNDSRDVVNDPHFRERTLTDLAGTVLGPALVPGPILHMTGYSGPQYDGVPAVGEHTTDVLTERLGLAADELAHLRQQRVVGPLVG